jgi:hypothetical protein
VDVFDVAEGTSRSIRRTGNGAIDVEYYETLACAPRARWMRLLLRKFIGRVVLLWRRRAAETGLKTFNAHRCKKVEESMTLPFPQQPRDFAKSWIDAWNRHDLDAVLAHFSDDFQFSSPLIHQIAGEPSGQLSGKEAVRAYWQAGLSRLPGLHFELVDVLVGVGCLTILYQGHRGLSAEVFNFGADGRAVRGQALYAAGA